MSQAAAKHVEDYRSGVPQFKVHGLTFVCWVTDNRQRYEWRAPGGLTVGRNVGENTCWARRNGQLVGTHFAKLRDAMEALV